MSEIPSMKRDAKREEFRKGILSSEGITEAEYPHGLCISLDDEELEKLQIQALPRIGQKFHIKGFASVKNLSEGESEGEGKERHMSLQITHLKLELVENERSHDAIFYGEADKPKVI